MLKFRVSGSTRSQSQAVLTDHLESVEGWSTLPTPGRGKRSHTMEDVRTPRHRDMEDVRTPRHLGMPYVRRGRIQSESLPQSSPLERVRVLSESEMYDIDVGPTGSCTSSAGAKLSSSRRPPGPIPVASSSPFLFDKVPEFSNFSLLIDNL